MKKILALLIVCSLALFIFAGCGNSTNNTTTSQTSGTTKTLSGKTLFIYSGAGMKQAVDKLVSAFETKTGAKVEVTYGNAANIISQITASNEGDIFIAGDKSELKTLQEKKYITTTMDLVKHIPVLAVQKGNPKNITGLKDLTKEGVTLVLGDNKATPIGKLADKALKGAGVLKSVDIASRTTTANEIATALSLKQCDAGIVWQENLKNIEGTEIVNTTDLDKYIKTVPAAALSCSANADASKAFMQFLASKDAQTIWQSCGYELVK